MGVFFTNTASLSPAVAEAKVSAALQAESMSAPEADQRAKEVVAAAKAETMPKTFQPLRFGLAFVVFALIIGVGIWAETHQLEGTSKALFTFGGTIFGVVTTLISGESKD